MFGDPHLVTLDGHNYTFNGHGEFTLIQSLDKSHTIQVQMTELHTNNASTQTLAGSGTVISAILAARVTITVQEKNSILSDLAVTLSDDYYQNILGLLGNYNGDKKDDF